MIFPPGFTLRALLNDDLWVCPKCGSKFETSISIGPELPLTPEITKHVFINLVGGVRNTGMSATGAVEEDPALAASS